MLLLPTTSLCIRYHACKVGPAGLVLALAQWVVCVRERLFILWDLCLLPTLKVKKKPELMSMDIMGLAFISWKLKALDTTRSRKILDGKKSSGMGHKSRVGVKRRSRRFIADRKARFLPVFSNRQELSFGSCRIIFSGRIFKGRQEFLVSFLLVFPVRPVGIEILVGFLDTDRKNESRQEFSVLW
jgi:hypothetical protein